jgi:hypothetical protein
MKDKLLQRIDEVLYYLWDPIGVSDEPNARDEYSNYITSIYSLLINDKSKEIISQTLSTIMTKNMGLTDNKDKCDEIADLLIRHKTAIKNMDS